MPRQVPLSFFLLLILGVCTNYLEAQENLPKPEITWQLEKVKNPSASWDGTIKVIYHIPAGLHILRQEDYFNLKVLRAPEGVNFKPVQYPTSKEKLGGFDLYTGEVALLLPYTLSKNFIRSNDNIKIQVLWQICYDSGTCLLPQNKIISIPFASVGPPEFPLDLSGLFLALGLAFLGGLLLNFMPCVLPVISLKSLSFMKLKENLQSRLSFGFGTVFGILFSFILLAVILIVFKQAGLSAGWGFQFQYPVYTLSTLLIVFIMALNLLGLWTFRGILLSRGLKKNSHTWWRNFLEGLLLVVLATPCTAPLLGSALGFAVGSSNFILILIFISAGLGFCLPFALICCFPFMIQWLPQPGPWMERFRQLMGFALMGTVIWLLSVLLVQIRSGQFILLLWFLGGVALILWVLNIIQTGNLKVWKRRIFQGLLIIFLFLETAFLIQDIVQNPIQESSENSAKVSKKLPLGWNKFDEVLVQKELDSGHSVFIDFGADWCLTCQLNEAGTLKDSKVLEAFHINNTILFRGDYTLPDPVMSSWMQRWNRAGVPFYLYLKPGKSGAVLPEILNADQLIKTLRSY